MKVVVVDFLAVEELVKGEFLAHALVGGVGV
jgi:hypothetical protein